MARRWLYRLLVIAFVWAVVSRLTEIEHLARTLAEGRWSWVLAAVLLQAVYYLTYAGVYQAAFAAVGIRRRVRDLLPAVFAALAVNVAAPTGGASGAALFVDDAVRQGESGPRAAASTLLALIADLAAFVLILVIGLGYLFTHHDLRPYEVISAVVLLGIIGGLCGVLLLGLRRPDRLHAVLRQVQKVVNRGARVVRVRPVLREEWPARTAAEFSGAASAMAGHPDRLARTAVTALAAHLIDLASLYALFLAFYRPVGPGVLVAGYAMGILFWIVAVTPQGIGVVEGVMALVWSSLGVPPERAAVIAVAFRGLTFWLPLGAGFVLLRRVRSFQAASGLSTGSWGVHAVAVLTALVGLVNVLSAITPSLEPRLEALVRTFPIGVLRGARLVTALAGFGLLALANNLWRRKRVAWAFALMLLVVSTITHLLKGLDYEEAALGAVLAVWFVLLRSEFHARSDPPSVRQGVRALVGALLFTLAYGTAGFYLLDRHFRLQYSITAALTQTLIMFTTLPPGPEPLTGLGRYFADSIYAVAVVTLAYAAVMLTRPVLVRHPAAPEERERARAIVEAYGRSSLTRFALFEDKAYHFTPGGSVVAYAVRGRGAIALGDPNGPPEDAPSAIAGFAAHCARNDWIPAFYQTLPDLLSHYQEAGFRSLRIGHEAIVDLTSFTLEGRANKELRGYVNRLTRLGHRTELHMPPLSDQLLRELREVSDEWLTMVKGSEKRFSLGWFDDDYIRGSPVMAVHDADDRITAFANIVSEYRLNETTIDLMRRRRDAAPGTMDFLFVGLFEWAKAQGFATFNLGLSPLAGVGERSDDPVVERALHYIYEHINQFYNFKGLHDFKSKFHPQWSPRYLMYPRPADLPAVAIAIIRADAGTLPTWTLVGDAARAALRRPRAA